MRQRKHEREQKRQRGQYMTPDSVADRVLRQIAVDHVRRVLEPSCGEGVFLRRLQEAVPSDSAGTCSWPTDCEVTGIEIDSELVAAVHRHGLPSNTSVHEGDFFRFYLDRTASCCNGSEKGPLSGEFDLIVGNPPFGGTFDHDIEDELDRLLGRRMGRKIKKETYAFFIIACADMLRSGGQLLFVCSDTLLTIPTMTGLRQYLMEHGDVTLTDLSEFSEETNYPMVVLDFRKRSQPSSAPKLRRNGCDVDISAVRQTPNLSWSITPEIAKLFAGPLLSDFFIASSGMTTGKNEYFIRELNADNTFSEPYEFRFSNEPVTVAYELERARLGKLPAKVRRSLDDAELRGDVQRRLHVLERRDPVVVQFPHPDYAPYNKANGRIVASPATHVIYWKDDGDAVLTYKKTGNWYLRGVGGQPYFGREGLTWQLVASRFIPRYLPPGYILDSGAPCAFTLPDTDEDELFFIIGWLLSPLANKVLKSVLNHTRNIQSKDFERMPYPWWVPPRRKRRVVHAVRAMVKEGLGGRDWTWSDPDVATVADGFMFDDESVPVPAEVEGKVVPRANRLAAEPTLFSS